MNNIIFNKTEYGAKSVRNGKDVMGMRTDCIGMAGALGQRIACSGEVSCGLETAKRALTKIEGDLSGIFGRFGWSFGVCLAGVVRFGSNMVRMMLAGFPRGAVCRTADAYSSSIYALVPGFRCRKAAALAVA